MAKNNDRDRRKGAIPIGCTHSAVIPAAAINPALLNAVEVKAVVDPALLNAVEAVVDPALFNTVEVPGAAEAIARYTELSKASDPGSKRLSELMEHLTLPEAMPLIDRIKPPPKKRGAKPGRRPHNVEIERLARANLLGDGDAKPSKKALANEIARIRGISDLDQIEAIRTGLYRS